MQIQAVDLIGEYEIRLENIENVFARLGEEAAKPGATVEQRKDIKTAIEEVQATRVQFEQIKIKYVNDIERALAGQGNSIELTPFETRLVDAIRDMYDNVRATHECRHSIAL